MRRFLLSGLVFLAILLLYLLFWPVPIDPVAWEAPQAPETGPGSVWAERRSQINVEALELGGYSGPESIAFDANGILYSGTEEGDVLRRVGQSFEVFARTEGRPLGLKFDAGGNLFVADGVRGLLRVDPSGQVEVLLGEVDGEAFGFADDLDISRQTGRIYLSDASTRFPVTEYGADWASQLDIVEHRGSGRLIEFDPNTGQARTLLSGLNFANGVALSANEDSVLICESGMYRVLRYWLRGPRAGSSEVFLENLPGFPDNITRSGTSYWLALAAPRNQALDSLSGSSFLRRLTLRLPAFMRPAAAPYTHVAQFDQDGVLLGSYEEAGGRVPFTTSAIEHGGAVYLGSLHGGTVGRFSP
ncbi:MAG: strictosidine synthase family protein [Spirochaetales bacterium]|nr:strictosidine synthase family protein [Leptospiraceae bacterium]MCP5481152.1 strictosidine synthase family protein [Spirochaetales bacterium]